MSNIMLNELDKELEKRGLRFARYADECIIAVRSEASAKRVMYSITDWIQSVIRQITRRYFRQIIRMRF